MIIVRVQPPRTTPELGNTSRRQVHMDLKGMLLFGVHSKSLPPEPTVNAVVQLLRPYTFVRVLE